MAVKPNQMTQQAWDYLLNFTETHEHPVLHMYNNKKSETDKQDVTFGIGIQINSPAAALGYRKYFTDKSGGQASDAAITSDWNAVSKILRTSGDVQAYENATQCRVSKESVRELMAIKLKGALDGNLAVKKELKYFAAMPEQAKIGLASYFYGHILPPKMGAATAIWDFYEAGVQSHLNGMSERKFKAHVVLFQNAAQIVAQKLDYGQIPLGFDPPSLVSADVDPPTAKAAGLATAASLETAKFLVPFMLNPLQLPFVMPPLGFGDKF